MIRSLFLLLAFIGWSGCESSKIAPPVKQFRVGLVLDRGGRADKSFNEAAFRGATQAKEELKIDLKTVEASDDSSYEPSFRTFAALGFDLIIGIGFSQAEGMRRAAADLPTHHFVIVDFPLEAPNVRSVMFKENEGTYLVGAIAAMASKQKHVGFIGGVDSPLIRRFELGFRSGATQTVPGTRVTSNYVGSTSEAWRNPTKAQELALSQYNNGVDTIFTAAGASALGVFDAAEAKKKWVIGCDSNQDCLKKGRVLTSMVKRVDLAVFNAIRDASQGKFKGEKVNLGLKEGGLDYTLDACNESLLSPEIRKKADAIKQKIIKGELSPPDFYTLKKAEKPS